MAGINYVLEVEATLERVDSGDMSALNGYHDLQVSEFDCLNTTRIRECPVLRVIRLL